LSKLAILILAAGNASRMGFPKQLLKWKDTNLLQHVINSVKQIENDGVYLVLGANYEKIISEIDNRNIHVLKNDTWQKGLGNSIVFGVHHITKFQPKTNQVLIVLADQPLINAHYFNTLINAHTESKQEITCTLYKDGKLGVPAIFNKAYFDKLLQLNQDKGAKEVLKKYSKDLKFVDGKDVIVDIDTMEDYKILYKKHHIEDR